jgi:uncharacterized sporulation protein YeaH/YhbH (DUF444 family)
MDKSKETIVAASAQPPTPAGSIWPPVAAEDLHFCEPPPLVAEGVYKPPGSFAWNRGPQDGARWLERSQRQQPDVMTVLNNRLFSIDEGEGVTLYVAGDTLWKFVFGRVNGGGGAGKGKGKAGKSKDSESDIEIHMSPEELDDMLFKNLALPNLIGKKSPMTECKGVAIEGIGKTGSHPELARKEMMRRYVGRVFATTHGDRRFERDESSGLLLPADKVPLARSDKRYWQLTEVREPVSQAVVYLLTDRSGSVNQRMLENAYLFNYLMIRFLTRQYKHITIVILGHTDGEPKFFESWQSLVADSMTGGTSFSPSLKWIRRHAQDNLFNQTHNCYLVQASDGDNDYSDNLSALAQYRGLLDDGFNYLTFIELADRPEQRLSGGTLLLTERIEAQYRKNIYVGRVWDRASVFAEFQSALKKDAARV